MAFFFFPFASDGTKTPIDVDTQFSGLVSYEEGFGPDYQGNILTDPDARPFPRAQFNQLMFDVTTAIRQYQTDAVPAFITSSDNQGTPFPYDQYARVRFNPGSGFRVYENQVAANITDPTDPSWVEVNSPINKMQQSYACIASAAGTANALTATPAVAFSALAVGSRILIRAAANNTGTTTINVSALGAVACRKITGAGYGAFGGGELITGGIYEFVYDGTFWFLCGQSLTQLSAELSMGASQSLANGGAPALINFNDAVRNPLGWANTGSSNMTVPYVGIYGISVSLDVSNNVGNATGSFSVFIYKNGTLLYKVGQYPFSGASDIANVSSYREVGLAAGDVLTVHASNSGTVASLTVGFNEPTNDETWFSVKYLGS